MVIRIIQAYNKNSFCYSQFLFQMSANLLRKEQSIDQNDNQSNVILSYSRLAQQVDKQEELLKDKNLHNEQITAKAQRIKNKQEQQQFIGQQQLEAWDGELIKVTYVQISAEKDRKHNENTYQMEQKCLKRGNARYNINGRLIDSSELKPITENDLENKRSEEEVTEKQIFVDTKAPKIGKTSSFQHTIQPVQSQSIRRKLSVQQMHFNKLKAKQVRTLQQSFEVKVDKKDEKIQKQKQEYRNSKQNDKLQKMNKSKQIQKCVLSSFSTASKLQKFRSKQSKTQQNFEKIDDQTYLAFLKNISKRLIGLENELESYVFKNQKSISLKKEISSSTNPIKLNSKPEISTKRDSCSQKQNIKRSNSIIDRSNISPKAIIQNHQKYRFEFCYFKDESKRKNNKITKQILLNLFNCNNWGQALNGRYTVQSIISLIDEIFQISDNSIKVLSKQPLAVVLQSFQLITLLSYSRKIYIGQFVRNNANIQKHGFGVQIDPKKSIYIGEFKQGIKHGFGCIYIQGFYFYKGQWVDGIFSGKGRLQNENGNTYDGNFFNGKKEGFGIENFPNGQYYKGFFKANRFNGKGCYYWQNGSSYEGDFHQGSMHGTGKWMSSQGDKYQGGYSFGLKEGWGTYEWKNGNIYVGQFYKGSPISTANKNQKKQRENRIQNINGLGEVKRFNVFFNF